MINRLKTPALLLGLAVMALGTTVSAQSFKVPKDCDTIQVSPGTYVENVVIGDTRAARASRPSRTWKAGR